MPIVCLAKVSPLDPATGNRVDLYLSSADDSRVTGLNGLVWEPALTAAPTLSINLWQGDFQEPVDTGGASFGFNIGILKMTYANADTYMWAGAPVEIYAEEPGTAWPWAQRFKGRVAGFSRRNQVVTINSKIDTEPFEKNVLTATYAGTTGAEGSADLKGRLKPLVIGWAKNVEPVLIDATNSVYQFSAYGAIEAVSVLYERATDFGASVGDYATYAALVAATIPAGRWATCLAAGMVRLGAPAAGVITGDIRGHRVGGTTPRLTGAVISALATIAGVSAGNIESATLTALDTAVAYPINIVLTEQAKFNDIAASLALACNWQSGITLQGKFFVLAVTLTGSEILTLNAQGAALPQVTSSDEQDVSVPYYETILGAARNWRVQSSDEIAFTAQLIPRGTYSASETYREGNIVTTDDGATWLYINTTAGSGNAPPDLPTTSNAYWSNMTGAVEGVPGPAGADGLTTYTWYAYADSADGAINFTTGSPASRVYQGISPNRTTATESTNPADYTWSQYAGPPNFGLAAANNGEVSGSKIVCRAGSTGWDAQVYSTESFTGGAYLSFKPELNGGGNYGGFFVGLNTDPTSTTWESIDYAIHPQNGTGQLFVGESGNLIAVGTYTGTDTFAIHYDGSTVRYYKNGTVFRTVAATAGIRFFLDSAMSAIAGVHATITAWAAAGAIGPQGVPGNDGLPGTPGANGTSAYTWYAYADSADGAINFTTGSPASRVYQGISPNRTTATESTNPADYIWTPYVGPPNFGLAAANGGEVAGAKIIKRSGANWDPQVYSTESFTGGAFVSFKPEVGNDAVMIGLNTDPTATDWTTLDYAIYLEAGLMNFAESGVIGTITSYSPSTDTFAIHYDGANVRYSKNGTVLRTVAAASGLRFFLDSAMSNATGVKATITAWSAAGAAGPQGPAGANGANGANGTNGSAGAPAIGFVQDTTPGAGSFVSQTWYRPTSKEWYRWDGGSWVRILGDLSAQNLIADSAYIADGVIINAKIGNLQVDTIKLAGNAVTLTSSAYTSTSINLTDDAWVDVQSVTITTIGAPILILFNGQSSQVTSGVFDIIRYRILRDASVIQGPIENWAYADENRNVSLSITDVPSAGTFTYKVQAFLQTSGGSANLTHRSLVAMETKR